MIGPLCTHEDPMSIRHSCIEPMRLKPSGLARRVEYAHHRIVAISIYGVGGGIRRRRGGLTFILIKIHPVLQISQVLQETIPAFTSASAPAIQIPIPHIYRPLRLPSSIRSPPHSLLLVLHSLDQTLHDFRPRLLLRCTLPDLCQSSQLFHTFCRRFQTCRVVAEQQSIDLRA